MSTWEQFSEISPFSGDINSIIALYCRFKYVTYSEDLPKEQPCKIDISLLNNVIICKSYHIKMVGTEDDMDVDSNLKIPNIESIVIDIECDLIMSKWVDKIIKYNENAFGFRFGCENIVKSYNFTVDEKKKILHECKFLSIATTEVKRMNICAPKLEYLDLNDSIISHMPKKLPNIKVIKGYKNVDLFNIIDDELLDTVSDNYRRCLMKILKD